MGRASSSETARVAYILYNIELLKSVRSTPTLIPLYNMTRSYNCILEGIKEKVALVPTWAGTYI